MASIRVENDEIRITLSPFERVAGLLPNLRVPVAAIRSAEAVPKGRKAVRGIRAPGWGGPVRLIGTWRARGNRQYVCVRRGQPAIELTIDDFPYRTVLVGTDDAELIAGSLPARG